MDVQLTSLIQRFRGRLRALPVQPAIIDDDAYLAQLLEDAAVQHAPGSTRAMLPPEEESLVVLLALGTFCETLAIHYAATPSAVGAGVSISSKGLSDQLMRLARYFEGQYLERASQRDPLFAGVSQVVSVSATRESLATGRLRPAAQARAPIPYYLHFPRLITSTTLTLFWRSSGDTNVALLRAVSSLGVVPDYVPILTTDVGEVVGTSSVVTLQQFAVTGLTADTEYLFCLFTEDGYGLQSRSNIVSARTLSG